MCALLADDQQLIQLLKGDRPSWQGLSSSTAEQLLMRLVMFIERRRALPEVLPWLWPLADEDSVCKVDVKPSLQHRLLAALIAIPEAADTVLGGKVRRMNMQDAKSSYVIEDCVAWQWRRLFISGWVLHRCNTPTIVVTEGTLHACMHAYMHSSVAFALQEVTLRLIDRLGSLHVGSPSAPDPASRLVAVYKQSKWESAVLASQEGQYSRTPVAIKPQTALSVWKCLLTSGCTLLF